MIFDTHAHYDDDAFAEDRDRLLTGLKDRGVDLVINVGAALPSLDQIPELLKQYPFMYGAIGIHPDEVGGLNDEILARMRILLRQPKVVAVGEIGLDYHWNVEERKTQIYWFERQIQLAREEKLPVAIHSRDAAEDTLETAKRNHLEEIGGVVHCFSYSKELAREYLNMGMYIGVGGVITFKNARRLKEVVEYAPLDRLLLETDCPYLAPEPNRGKRNDSGNLKYVAEAIGRIKGVDPEKVIEQTERNGMRLFQINKAGG